MEGPGGNARVTIQDTGQGIPAEFLPRLFTAFSQADSTSQRVHGGLGLGLSIVRHLVQLHKGSVEASSEGPGRGATFIVRLPLAAAEEAAAPVEGVRGEESALEKSASESLRGTRVLLVEDEDRSREAIQQALQSRGARVRAVSSVSEAMKVLPEVLPDLIVSDIAMPGEDGFSLLRRVRALPPDQGGRTPALALSAHADDRTRSAALTAGFQAHLAKPVEVDEFCRALLRLKRAP